MRQFTSSRSAFSSVVSGGGSLLRTSASVTGRWRTDDSRSINTSFYSCWVRSSLNTRSSDGGRISRSFGSNPIVLFPPLILYHYSIPHCSSYFHYNFAVVYHPPHFSSHTRPCENLTFSLSGGLLRPTKTRLSSLMNFLSSTQYYSEPDT